MNLVILNTNDSHGLISCFQIASQVPDIVSRLQVENSASSMDCCKNLSELLYTLMYQFPGYPEVYVPIIEAIKVGYTQDPQTIGRRGTQIGSLDFQWVMGFFQTLKKIIYFLDQLSYFSLW